MSALFTLRKRHGVPRPDRFAGTPNSLTGVPSYGNMGMVEVYGEATIAKFAKKHPPSRKPLQRFLEIVRHADWPHFAAVKNTLASADYVSGRLVFDIGGNKYRLVASVDFDEQILVVNEVMTHEEYDRERI